VLLAGLLLERGETLSYTPRWITTGAENLMPHQAGIIREAFGRFPVQHYGMAEAVANFFQCPAGALHVDEDFAAVEFLPVAGEEGLRVVGTNLSNPATPLLRYDVGDRVEIAASSCACGLPGRVIACVDGRQEDLCDPDALRTDPARPRPARVSRRLGDGARRISSAGTGSPVTSYHVSPFLDSALVVECEGTTLLNANDAKLMGGPLRHVLRRHPRIDFVFRSHSSANSRLSYQIVGDPSVPLDDLTNYIRSFTVFAQATGRSTPSHSPATTAACTGTSTT
jgi:hypothetical protein